MVPARAGFVGLTAPSRLHAAKATKSTATGVSLKRFTRPFSHPLMVRGDARVDAITRRHVECDRSRILSERLLQRDTDPVAPRVARPRQRSFRRAAKDELEAQLAGDDATEVEDVLDQRDLGAGVAVGSAAAVRSGSGVFVATAMASATGGAAVGSTGAGVALVAQPARTRANNRPARMMGD